MSSETAVFIAIGAAFGGFINGLAGFGVSLFALGWWLQTLKPVEAVAVSLTISVLTGFQGVWIVRHAIQIGDLMRYLVPAILGIPIGLSLLTHLSPEPLTVLIAIFLLAYGAYFAFQRNLPSLDRPTPIIDGLIGFAGGVLGALAGLSGALPTVWLSLRPWAKAKTRGILQPYNTVVLGIAALLLILQGAFDATVLLALAIAIPVALASAQIGIALFNSITDATFRRLLILLMLASGAALLVRSVSSIW
jgi:uncharacterized membrane protein YfcA